MYIKNFINKFFLFMIHIGLKIIYYNLYKNNFVSYNFINLKTIF